MFGRPSPAPQRRLAVLRPLTAAALTALVYLNALSTPFVYDDHYLIVENHSIRNLADVRAIVLLLPTRPLVNVSYAIDYAIWGLDPFGYHLTNVALHLLNVILLFYLTERFLVDREQQQPTASRIPIRGAAFGVALLFGIHPMMTSAVTYVTGRSEVLCATFFLASMLCGRRWLHGHGRRWWAFCSFFWVAALGTKEVAIMLPLVLFCYQGLVIPVDHAQRRRSLLLLMVPLALLAAVVRVVTFMLAERPSQLTVHWEYLPRQIDVAWRYLLLMVAPERQTIFHVVPDVTLTDARGVAVVAGFVALLVVMWRLRRAAALVTFGLSWFLLMLFPSTMLALASDVEPMVEHRVYLASGGLFVAGGTAAAWLVGLAEGRALRFGLLTIFGVVILSFAGRALLRNAVRADPVGLWREAVFMAPSHPMPHLLLAEALQSDGRADEAIAEYRKGIDLSNPHPLAYQQLALALVKAGRLDEAVSTLEELRRVVPHSAVASNGLGAIALMRGEPERARAFFMASLATDPQNVAALRSLALMAETEPVDAAEALRLCQEIQRIAPRTPGNDDCINRNRARLSVPAGISR